MVAWDPSSSKMVLILSSSKLRSDVLVATRNKDYGNVNLLKIQATNQLDSSVPSSLDPTPLYILTELTIKPPKCIIHKSSFNPHATAGHNYNTIEDLAQSSSAILTLEVLQNFPNQKRALLSTTECVDPSDSHLFFFSHENYTLQLPAQLAFIILVIVHGNNIHHSIMDEGASTCIMPMSCQKAIGSPQLSHTPTTLKAFDRRRYQPCGILNSLQVELRGKIVSIEVKFIDGILDYNILL